MRRPPRGVRKEDYAARNIYDVWFPNLAPSEALLKAAPLPADIRSWQTFRRKFLAEMKLFDDVPLQPPLTEGGLTSKCTKYMMDTHQGRLK